MTIEASEQNDAQRVASEEKDAREREHTKDRAAHESPTHGVPGREPKHAGPSVHTHRAVRPYGESRSEASENNDARVDVADGFS